MLDDDTTTTSRPGTLVHKRYPDYSRESWDAGVNPQNEYWTCSEDEFLAMSYEQWVTFGTALYIPPKGYNTAVKHVSTKDLSDV